MTRLAMEIGDRLTRGGQDFRFDGRRNESLDFCDDRTGERIVLTDAELATGIGRGDANLIKRRPQVGSAPPPSPPSGIDLDTLPAPEREKARLRLTYVQGAINGNLAGGAANSKLLDLVTMVAEQTEDPDPPSTKTLRRWLRCRSATPMARQFVSRNELKGNRSCRLQPEVVAVIEAKIDEVYMARPPVSVVTLHAHVIAAVSGMNTSITEGDARLTVPSIKALQRRIAARPPRDVMAARHGEAKARQAFDMVHAQAAPEAPLDLVELDHTVSDLMVVCGRTWLPFGKATLAASIDRCTRMPFGIYLGFEPPSVHTVMQCLRNGMLPKTYMDEKVASGEWDVKHKWPVCGRPRALLLDRGMENLGVDLDAMAGEVGIHLRFAPRKSPWFKGAIERFFRTLNSSLLHEQRGTTFSNVVKRDDYDPAKNAVVTLEELLYVLHRWLVDVYACSVHRGMRDVPARLWDELTVKHPIQPVCGLGDLDCLLGRVEHRILQRTGVTLEHVPYCSEEAVALLGDARFRQVSGNRQVRFRYDPADLGSIRLYDPCRKSYMTVPAVDQDYASGLSIWQHRVIVGHVNSRNQGAADIEGCARAKVEIAAVFERAMANRKMGTRKAAARHDGVGRLAPAGASHATSPAGSVASARARRSTLPAEPKLPPAPAAAPAAEPSNAQSPDKEDIYASLGIKR